MLDGNEIELREIPRPVAEPGEVLLEVLAAGLCHSDITLAARDPQMHPFALPLVLGHEICGRIIEMPVPHPGLLIGDLVAVHGPRGCGQCRTCENGEENYCPHAAPLKIRPPGLGQPGGLAEYVVITDPEGLIPLDGLDPIAAAPLTDAGLTAYHAVQPLLSTLTDEDTCVVIGIGGLGHIALQLLTRLSAARIIAIDIDPTRVTWARELGAHEGIVFTSDTGTRIRELTQGLGASVILDFVSAQDTLDAAVAGIRVHGEIVVVGVGPGRLPVAIGAVPLGVRVRTSYWGSAADLRDVLALARQGVITSTVERVTLQDVPEAYRRLDDGHVRGRIVATPSSRLVT